MRQTQNDTFKGQFYQDGFKRAKVRHESMIMLAASNLKPSDMNLQKRF